MKMVMARSSGTACAAAASTSAPLHAARPSIRPLTSGMRHRHIARASFDEGAAQVRRLLDRDRKELNFEELENAFAAKPRDDNAAPDATSGPDAAISDAASREATAANSGASFAADKTPVSPFGPTPTPSPAPAASPFGAAGAAASPFGGSSSPPPARKPFNEPAGLSPTMAPDIIEETPWWTRITTTQIVIVLSFTTIISLMIATFFFVLNVGAVRFNE